MAADLNKNRMMLSRVLVVIVVLAAFFTTPVLLKGTVFYGLCRLAGFVLLIACAIGRIYSTAFIGGVKNKDLVIVGAYSVHRNPLYFYSLLGAAGVGLMSVQLTSFLVLFCGFFMIYKRLIDREEKFLDGKFGKDFAEYKSNVPKLWPNFKLYSAPAELLFQPKYLTKAVWDAVWWFAPMPLFVFADYLRHAGIIKPLFALF